MTEQETLERTLAISAILDYPRLMAKLEARERAIIEERKYRHDGTPGSGEKYRPTEIKAWMMDSDHSLRAYRSLTGPVTWELAKLRPEHRRVICLRFWGTHSPEEAREKARAGEPTKGLKYDTRKEAEALSGKAGYSDRQARRIVKKFIEDVGKNMGRI